MTTKPPSGLAASGTASDEDAEQITKEHDENGQDINVDPSEDVTVEATEDVTQEASSRTPAPQPRPGTVGVSAAQRAPTLLGVPIASLPLPGVTSASDEDATRTIDYNEEITVLAQPAPNNPLAVLDALDRPSITDDDEEETKVEPAETAMKAAETLDDVTTALSAQASLEREKALRRSASPASALGLGDDLEFADPEADDDQDENIDDELDDGDEVISAGGAIEEEEDDLGESSDGVATATFMKPADTTGLSGLLNPRRPPTGGRDGFGSRLPTPYPPPQSPIPGPSTSPFASRLGPAPGGSPYGARPTGSPIPSIQVPPPSGKATTETGPSVFTKKVPVPVFGAILLGFGFFVAGFGFRGLTSGGKSAPAPIVVAKPAAPAAAAVVVTPVQTGTPAAPANPEVQPVDQNAPNGQNAPAKPIIAPVGTEATVQQLGDNPDNPEAGLWRPAKKPAPAAKPRKQVEAADEDSLLGKPKPAIAKEPKPAPAPKPAVVKEPKPTTTTTASAKPGKKPTKAWVDPFAN